MHLPSSCSFAVQIPLAPFSSLLSAVLSFPARALLVALFVVVVAYTLQHIACTFEQAGARLDLNAEAGHGGNGRQFILVREVVNLDAVNGG